ncbi:unnamed protein product [Phyllotreta striolata]|uniref:Uncharacterized protein n=1 Tax=Phyllotreta striolata TaxID=444603 RepID=A0A9N9TL91_PHYSR|nr:unnamed protein product [Phyllotreta striolata]
MARFSCLLIKFFVLFWLVCAAVCASQRTHHKRDIHRIILQERSPRGHKKHGVYGHAHSKKKGHKSKIRNNSDESNSSSYEDSVSEETSFELIPQRHKTQKKQSHRKPKKIHQRHPTNLDIEETRLHSYREELLPFSNSDWVPLQIPPEHHQIHHREKDRRSKRKPKKHSHNKSKPYRLESTTYIPLTFDSSTLYPPIDVLSSFASLNKNIMQTNPSILSTFEHTTAKDSGGKMSNHKSGYDVTEHQPSDLSELILVPDKTDYEMNFGSTGKYEFKDSKNRGGFYRGRTKY